MKYLLLNQESSGKFERQVINNRPHILTDFIAVVGNSVMNEIFYPADLVIASAKDLVGKMAPASHPQVSGRKISADHPLAINAHNIGGFVANVRVEGDTVIATVAIDVEVAEKDERGKQIIQRIENGERLACSTGLDWDCTEQDGIANGRKYKYVMNSIKWDHFALLLNEDPAGEQCYNIVNCNVNNQDDRIPATNEPNPNNHESPHMDLKTLLKVLVANSNTALIEADLARLEGMSENELSAEIINSVVKPDTTIDEAKALVEKSGLVVNSSDELAEFNAQKDAFDAFKAEKAEQRKALIDEVVTNSKLTADQLAAMSDDQITAIQQSIQPAQDYSGRGTQILNSREESSDDYADYGA